MNQDASRGSIGSSASRLPRFFSFPHTLIGRLYLLGALAALEYLACYPATAVIFGHQRFHRIAIVAFAVFVGLGHSRLKAQQEEIPFGRSFFSGNLLAIAAILTLDYGNAHGFGWSFFDGSGYLRSSAFLLAAALLALGCIPIRNWIGTIRTTGFLWLYSLLAGVAGWYAGDPLRTAWNLSTAFGGGILQRVAFHSVRAVLSFILPGITSDAATLTIGTPRYSAFIAGGCSGIEGLGLVLVFTIVWLWYFRKETRFPQAFLLVPCALVSIWLLNIARLCALIFIGDSISEEVADVGFHSQAGWMAFTAVALGFSMATQRLSWVRKRPLSASSSAGDLSGSEDEASPGFGENVAEERGESPAIRAYLIPFLAILAASIVSKAASGHFEWLYPLRFVAAATAVWFFRKELRKVDWHFGWVAPLVGAGIFFLWVAPSWFLHRHEASPLGPALLALPFAARWGWIAIRAVAAVVTVPIAEELAFRGYLARRLVSRSFDQVPFTHLTMIPVVISSAVFGLMHGQHWLVGIVAGLAYAGVVRWTGRFGDAVAAHATSNLLLAAWVLVTGDWSQW